MDFALISNIATTVYANLPAAYGTLTGLTLIWSLFLLMDARKLIDILKAKHHQVRLSDKYIIYCLPICIALVIGTYFVNKQLCNRTILDVTMFFEFWYALLLVRMSEIVYKTIIVVDCSRKGNGNWFSELFSA